MKHTSIIHTIHHQIFFCSSVWDSSLSYGAAEVEGLESALQVSSCGTLGGTWVSWVELEKSGFREMQRGKLSSWVGKLVRQGCEKRRGNRRILVKRTRFLSWVSNYNKHSQEGMSSRDYIEYDNTSKGALLNWKTSLEMVRAPHVHQWKADETWELGEGYSQHRQLLDSLSS